MPVSSRLSPIVSTPTIDWLSERVASGTASPDEMLSLTQHLRLTGQLHRALSTIDHIGEVRELPEMAEAIRRILRAEGGPRLDGPVVPVPYVIWRNFLLDHDRQGLLEYVETHRDQIRPAVSQRQDSHHMDVNATLRDGYSLRIAGQPRRGLVCRVLQAIDCSLRQLGLRAFAPTKVVCHMAAYTNGRLRVHKDGAHAPTISGTYYFWREPREFDGGDLMLYDDDRDKGRPAPTATRLSPSQNSLILFPSDSWHEVLPVNFPRGDVVNGRLSVVFWVAGVATRL